VDNEIRVGDKMKRSTCLYIEEKVIEACKVQGVNMSVIAEKALRAVLAGQHFRNEDKYLEFLVDSKRQIEKDVEEWKEKITLKKEKLGQLEAKISTQSELVEIIKSSHRVASIILTIIEVIKSYRYDIDVAWKECNSLVEELAKLKHPVDRHWFEQQVERLQSGFLE